MANRMGEKAGWIGGWMGGFLWVLLLAAVWTVQGRMAAGLTGLLLAGIAVAVVLTTAPWRHPDQPYWKLMLPVYFLLGVCVAWAALASGGLTALGLNWWSAWWLIPLLFPFGSVGHLHWNDRTPTDTHQAGDDKGCRGKTNEDPEHPS
ncbi:MAG: hypothetical protein WC256_02225 [Desulfurivibrionaceae bacterium]|jgi:hypothetical protein